MTHIQILIKLTHLARKNLSLHNFSFSFVFELNWTPFSTFASKCVSWKVLVFCWKTVDVHMQFNDLNFNITALSGSIRPSQETFQKVIKRYCAENEWKLYICDINWNKWVQFISPWKHLDESERQVRKVFHWKSSMNGILKRDAHKQEPLSSCQIRKTNSIL